MTIKRVAYVKTNFWFGLKAGGSVTHTSGVISGLRSQSIDLDIYAPERPFGVATEVPFTELPARFRRLSGWIQEGVHNVTAGGQLRRALTASRPDAVYHRYNGMTWMVYRASTQLGIPLILEFNSSDAWKLAHWDRPKGFRPIAQLENRIQRPLVAAIEAANLRAATTIVVVSEVLRDDLVARGVPGGKILVNPNAVDPALLIERPGARDAKRRELQMEGRTVLTYVGTFGQWHGIPQLVESIRELNARHGEGRLGFLLIGKGALKDFAVNSLNGVASVRFAGEVPFDQIPAWYAASDILLSPHVPNPDGTRFFGSPTKLFEYMATGKALAASALEQIGDIIRDGETGLLSEPGNVGDFVRQVSRLIDDPPLRQRLGENARREVLANHTWDRHVEKTLRFTEARIAAAAQR